MGSAGVRNKGGGGGEGRGCARSETCETVTRRLPGGTCTRSVHVRRGTDRSARGNRMKKGSVLLGEKKTGRRTPTCSSKGCQEHFPGPGGFRRQTCRRRPGRGSGCSISGRRCRRSV